MRRKTTPRISIVLDLKRSKSDREVMQRKKLLIPAANVNSASSIESDHEKAFLFALDFEK